MAAKPIQISDRPLGFADLKAAHAGRIAVTLTGAARRRIAASAKAIGAILEAHEPVYGVNTGFGKLAQKRIDDDHLSELQLNIIRSHAAGTGDPLPDAIVRLILLLKVKSLAQGHSGVSLALMEKLCALVEADVLPVIPSQGSVGASGDLAPLAHMSLVLLGEGRARMDGREMTGAQALEAAGIAPHEPGPKEGLALLNGTQVSTAITLAALFDTEHLMSAALVAGAMAVDAILGSDTPFDARIHGLRPHPGQIATATVIRDLLAGSRIRASHVDCERVQDPYSFRCQPQVIGACLDRMHDTARTLAIEANAVTDNPLVFADTLEVLSGGNFHAEPVAFAADGLALAIAEIGALSERRCAAMIDTGISQLPPFLVSEPGLNSGFMLAQVTAAALASENRALAHPRSTDSLPTSANQEDHVSMSTNAANRLAPMIRNGRAIVAVELLSAAQGIDLRRPLKSSRKIEAAHALIRDKAAFWDKDRVFAGDLEAVAAMIRDGAFDMASRDIFRYGG
jgi:histidine ammonia-lyase